jgi:hypothetical protein
MNPNSTPRQLLITHEMYDLARNHFISTDVVPTFREATGQEYYRQAAGFVTSWIFNRLEQAGDAPEPAELFLVDDDGEVTIKPTSTCSLEDWEQARDQAVAETIALLVAAFKNASQAAVLHGHVSAEAVS